MIRPPDHLQSPQLRWQVQPSAQLRLMPDCHNASGQALRYGAYRDRSLKDLEPFAKQHESDTATQSASEAKCHRRGNKALHYQSPCAAQLTKLKESRPLKSDERGESLF